MGDFGGAGIYIYAAPMPNWGWGGRTPVQPAPPAPIGAPCPTCGPLSTQLAAAQKEIAALRAENEVLRRRLAAMPLTEQRMREMIADILREATEAGEAQR